VPRSGPLGVRARVAIRVGAAASWASRSTGRGSGATLPGTLGLRVAPDLMSQLASGRDIAVVSATNGKTTTTRMLAAALGTSGGVLSNTNGSNLARGVLAALMTDPFRTIQTCAFEVDELALGAVAAAVNPKMYVLGNLSRDQLDRMTEVRVLVGHWQVLLAHAAATAVRAGHPAPVVVANADDPMVAAAVMSGADFAPVLPVVWVGVGQPWVADAAACPQCGSPWTFKPDYACLACGFSRPEPSWTLDGLDMTSPQQTRWRLDLSLPGRSNRANATIAIAAAHCLGVPVDQALASIRELPDVGGRYAQVDVDGSLVRLLLAKNPAGWQEMLAQAIEEAALDPHAGDTPVPVVLALNAQGPDGRDTSWIWDVPFEALAGRTIAISGERAEDLAVRLRYAELDFIAASDPLVALSELIRITGAARVDLLANYTAFTAVRDQLGVT
jgi:UDP-N-acetylmuramyl tripeptide synthase